MSEQQQGKGLQIDSSWKPILEPETAKPYFIHLSEAIKAQKKAGKTIYPAGSQIFRAFDLTPFPSVAIVILGQDPYHTPGMANGLAFSVNPAMRLPPSLQNIYRELAADLAIQEPTTGDLSPWATQGVLLLNSILTVEKNAAASHQNLGWQNFTDTAISAISKHREGIVFMLWGKFAQQKSNLIDDAKHLILTAPHPSPFSAHSGFFGCRHFSKANDFLKIKDKGAIDWTLP